MSKLQDAKLKVMADVSNIAKTSAPGLRYQFIAHAELVKSLRAAMIKHGVTVSPKEVGEVTRGEYSTAKGARMATVGGVFYFTFSCGDDYETVSVLSEAADSSDKASSKAQTQALKYALRQYFLIEHDEDDPDASRHERASVRQAKLATAIRNASTQEEIDKLMAMAEDPSLVSFTPEQQQANRQLFNARIEDIEAKASSNPRTDGPQESEGEGST